MTLAIILAVLIVGSGIYFFSKQKKHNASLPPPDPNAPVPEYIEPPFVP